MLILLFLKWFYFRFDKLLIPVDVKLITAYIFLTVY